MSMATPATAAVPTAPRRFDPAALRAQFPALHQAVHGKPLAYLDNAATTQKPRRVIDAERRFYEQDNANIHRGVHLLSQRATLAYEAAREKVRHFLGAASEREIVFTRGTTESVNLVAQSYARPRLRPGDEVLISHMEHHSNIVPWQLVCAQTGATLRVAPIDDRGQLDVAAFDALVGERTRIVAMVHVSNALGTVNPIEHVIARAKAAGAAVLIDGAQAVAHVPVDVRALGCDFYAFSGHKLYGPTGAGVLYGRAALLEEMPPWQGGGDMIREVRLSGSTWAEPPAKFEAGTPNIAGVVALGEAIDFVAEIGIAPMAAWEAVLLDEATAALCELDRVRLIGTAEHKASVLGFVIDGVHPHDIGTVLDMEGVAVRAGHHCAQPVMERFGVPATARASFAAYNDRADVERLVAGCRRVLEIFR